LAATEFGPDFAAAHTTTAVEFAATEFGDDAVA
jgi:hypothetical protein